jgi:uncharacterized membrane protein
MDLESSTRGGWMGLLVLAWLLAALCGVVLTVFWMVVGWRAMRAHERLADALDRLSRKAPPTEADRDNPFA